jgi:hypothetical protein
MTLVRAMRPSLSHRRGGSSPTARLGARHGALGLGWRAALLTTHVETSLSLSTPRTALLASVGMWRLWRLLVAGASSVNIVESSREAEVLV